MPHKANIMTPSSTDPPLCSVLAPTKHQRSTNRTLDSLAVLADDERSADALAIGGNLSLPSPARTFPIELINESVHDP